MLTRLIQGEVNENGGEGGTERLLAKELLHNCIFLLNAGHETTTNLIGNGLQCLLDWPGQKALLLAQPELIKTAVEEFLRFESSNQLGNRITTCATRDRRRVADAAHLGHAVHRLPRTATLRSSPIPTGSTSRARRTGTSRSARAFISASAWGLGGSKGVSRSAGFCSASRTIGSTAPHSAAGACGFADMCTCRAGRFSS